MPVSLSSEITTAILSVGTAYEGTLPTIAKPQFNFRVVIHHQGTKKHMIFIFFLGKKVVEIQADTPFEYAGHIYYYEELKKLHTSGSDCWPKSLKLLGIHIYNLGCQVAAHCFPAAYTNNKHSAIKAIASYKHNWDPTVIHVPITVNYLNLPHSSAMFFGGASSPEGEVSGYGAGDSTVIPGGVVQLSTANVIGQKVFGTSDNSVYKYTAFCSEGLKVATRIQLPKISIRAESAYDIDNFAQAIAGAGLNMASDTHASLHVKVANKDDVPRVIGGVIWALKPLIVKENSKTP